MIVAMITLTPVANAIEKNKAAQSVDTNSVLSGDSTQAPQDNKVVVYYLHMNRRCQTCKKLEAYSHEALQDGFADQLKDSSVIWRVVNFEEKDNEHYGADYQLYSQSLILSKLRNGKEVQWENLDKIWELVGHKDKFLAYVQNKVRRFMTRTSEKKK